MAGGIERRLENRGIKGAGSGKGVTGPKFGGFRGPVYEARSEPRRGLGIMDWYQREVIDKIADFIWTKIMGRS